MMLFLTTPVFAQNQNSLRKDMEFLTSPALNGRGAGTGSDITAAIYVSERARLLGYKEVKIDNFSIEGCAEKAVNGVNVEATKPSFQNNHKTIILGAHLDGASPNEKGEFVPAADDNASGSAVLMRIAEKVAERNWNNDILLVWFGAEEKGLCGSLYFTANHDTTNYLYMINLDMVGRPVNDLFSVYLEGDDENLNIRKAFFEANIKNRSEMIIGLGEYAKNNWEWWSDHYTFKAKAKIPAVMVNDGHLADTHTPADSLDKINFEYMEKVANLIHSALIELDKKSPD